MDLKFFNKKSFQVPMAVVCFLLAFVVTWQFRGVYRNTQIRKQQELESEKALVMQNQKLSEQLEQYRADIEKYREAAANNSSISAKLLADLEKAEMMAGITDVYGEGVILTVTDGSVTGSAGANFDVGLILIHDNDITMLLNELRSAGVEAMSINGERVLATTEVRCAGPTISINNTRYAVPLEVKAIGDADTIVNALNMPHGVKYQFDTFGLGLEIEKASDIVISGYKKGISFTHAQPVKAEEEVAQ